MNHHPPQAGPEVRGADLKDIEFRSGGLNCVVRVPPELHKALTIRALQRGESLNLFCKKALEEAV